MISRLRFLLPGSLCLLAGLAYAIDPITLSNSIIDEELPAATEIGVLASGSVPKVVKVANYLDSSAVILEDGSLWVWGKNDAGQLGNGTTANINLPFQLESSGVAEVDLGVNFIVYLKEDGSLWASGDNAVGQLGNSSSVASTTPVQVFRGGSGITAIAAGDRHNLILKSNGSLWGTGVNFDGQLGDGTTDNRLSYVEIVGSGVEKIAAGWAHSMYIGTDGSLWTWGVNDNGAIGNEAFDVNDQLTPFKVEESGVDHVDGGFQSTYYRKTDGSLWAMGYNSAGQLGNGNTDNQATPVQVVGSGVTRVEAGDTFVLYEMEDGIIYAVGDNFWGRMGPNLGHHHTPITFGVSNVTELEAYRQSLFIDSDGSAFIMGYNESSALGDGDTSTERDAPYYHLLGGTFALVDGDGDTDNASFTIEGYRLKSGVSLPAGNYSIRVLATPATGNPVEQSFAITVLDVNYSPEIGGLGLVEGNEDEPFAIFSSDSVGTFAGTGEAGETDGASNVATFNAPNGLAVDSQGNVFVVDHLSDKIRKIAPDGTVSTFAGNGVPTTVEGNGLSAGFDRPTGITIDSSDTIYLVEGNGTVVRMVTPSADAVNIAGKVYEPGFVDGNATDAMFGYPFDVVIDEANNFLFITDLTNHAIRKVDLNLDPSDSNFVSTVAGNGLAGFADGNGSSAQFNEPLGIDIDSAGNLYVTDGQNHRIRKIAPNGDVTTLAGTGVLGDEDGGVVSAQFNTPRGIVVFNDTTLYVAEYHGNKIREINLTTNTVSRVFGDGSAEDVDGAFDVAKTKNPSALTSHEGDLYLSSFDGHTVRKISLPGSLHVYDPDADDIITVNLSVTNGVVSVVLEGQATISDGANHSAELSIQGTQAEVNQTLESLQFTPDAEYHGNSTLSYSVSDGTVTTQSATTSITVQSVNDAPILFPIGNLSTNEDSPLMVSVAATDIEDDSLSWSALVDSGNVSASVENNVLSLIPQEDWFGNATIIVSLDDGNGGITSETIVLEVTPQNDSPILVEIGDQSSAKNTPFVVTLSATDIDEDDLLFSAEGYDNLQVSIAGDQLTITPTDNWAGVESIVVQVNDGNEGMDSETVEIEISSVPTISTLQPISGFIGTDIPITTAGGVVSSIEYFSGNGEQGSLNGDKETAQFSYPASIALDTGGNFIVADYDNNLIRKIDSNGQVTLVAGNGNAESTDGVGGGASFNRPSGVAVDLSGNVYVVDHGGHVVRKITTAGEVSTIAGVSDYAGYVNGSGSNARFNRPFGITIDVSSPSLYISEWGNHTIRKIDLSLDTSDEGFVTTLAGSGVAGFADDEGESAQFNYPHGLEFDGQGAIFVADHWNHRVRQVTTSGVVTTVAGNGGKGASTGLGLEASIEQPWAVRLNGSEQLLVSTGKHYIQSVALENSNEVEILIAEGNVQGFEGSTGRIADMISVDGTLYVLSQMMHGILEIELGVGSLSVSDAEGDILTVSLSVNDGSLVATLAGETEVTAGSFETAAVTIRGSAEDLNETLASLIYHTSSPVSSDTLSYSISDGTSTSEVQTVLITLVPLQEPI